MPPLKLIAAIRRRVLAWRARRWIRELLTYDDHMLADLGWRRQDLYWALQLPLTTDAADVLRQQQRRGDEIVPPAGLTSEPALSKGRVRCD